MADRVQFIGKVSRDTGLRIDTIRFYEKVGLIKHPHRTRGKYRAFSIEDIQNLRLIRKLVDLGFSLKEMKLLLDRQRKKMNACMEVRDLSRKKLMKVRGKIRLLRSLEQELSHDLRRQRLT